MVVALVLALLGLVGSGWWSPPGAEAARRRTQPVATAPAPVREPIEVWRGVTGGGVRSSPVVVNGVAYVGSDDGYLYAFGTAADRNCAKYTCMALWRGTTGGPVSSSPAVANGFVYVGSEAGDLYAFDVLRCASTPWSACEPAWRGATAGPVVSSPVVANGVVYVGSRDGNLYAFAAAGCAAPRCARLWRGQTRGPVSSSPALGNGTVYVGSDDGHLYAFTANGCGAGVRRCTPRWRGTTGGPVTSSPALGNGFVYVGSHDGALHAFAAGGCAPAVRCSPRWRGATGGAVTSSPVVVNGTVYVGSHDGRLYAFAGTPTGCSPAPVVCPPRWTGATRGAVSSSPAVVHGTAYVGSADGRLYAFGATGAGCSGSPRACAPVWSDALGGAVSSSPTVVDGVLFVGSESGSLVSERVTIDPIAPSFTGAVVTPELTDTYRVLTDGILTSVAAPASNRGYDTRVSFFRGSDRPATDGQSCAVWTRQSAGMNQQGAVLRARRLPSGDRRGILVTKNVWLNAHWVFNVHVWDTRWPEVFRPIGFVDLSAVFRPNGVEVPLPWSMCARAVGNIVSFIAWPTNSPRPAWNDPRHGGSITLPPGWGEPGHAGWYVGHLRPGEWVGLTDLRAGPIAVDERAVPGFGPETTTPPKPPVWVPSRL